MNGVEHLALLMANPNINNNGLLIAQLSNIDKVTILENELLELAKNGNAEKAEIRIKHYFVPGVYVRELFMPKGTVLTGKIHKYPQFHVITKGDLSVLIDGEMVRLTGPCNIMSPAGSKRLAIANEDTYWLMVHGTYQTDLDQIEKQFTCNTEKEYFDFVAEEERLEKEHQTQLSLFRDEQW